MVNKENLIPQAHRLTVEEASRGGIASGKARAAKKELRERITEWLDSEVGKDKKGNPLTGTDLMLQVAVKEMAKGNPKFWELIRDTAGQKPVDKVMVAEVEQSVIDEVERMVNNGKC